MKLKNRINLLHAKDLNNLNSTNYKPKSFWARHPRLSRMIAGGLGIMLMFEGVNMSASAGEVGKIIGKGIFAQAPQVTEEKKLGQLKIEELNQIVEELKKEFEKFRVLKYYKDKNGKIKEDETGKKGIHLRDEAGKKIADDLKKLDYKIDEKNGVIIFNYGKYDVSIKELKESLEASGFEVDEKNKVITYELPREDGNPYFDVGDEKFEYYLFNIPNLAYANIAYANAEAAQKEEEQRIAEVVPTPAEKTALPEEEAQKLAPKIILVTRVSDEEATAGKTGKTKVEEGKEGMEVIADLSEEQLQQELKRLKERYNNLAIELLTTIDYLTRFSIMSKKKIDEERKTLKNKKDKESKKRLEELNNEEKEINKFVDKFSKKIKEESDRVKRVNTIDELAKIILEGTELLKYYNSLKSNKEKIDFLDNQIVYINNLLPYGIRVWLEQKERTYEDYKFFYQLLSGKEEVGKIDGYKVTTAAGIRLLILALNDLDLKRNVDAIKKEYILSPEYKDILNILIDIEILRYQYVNKEIAGEKLYEEILNILKGIYGENSEFYKKVKESENNIKNNDDALFSLLSICELKMLINLRKKQDRIVEFEEEKLKLAERHFSAIFHPATRKEMEEVFQKQGYQGIIFYPSAALIFANTGIANIMGDNYLDMLSYIYRSKDKNAISSVIPYLADVNPKKQPKKQPYLLKYKTFDIGDIKTSTFLTGVFNPENNSINKYIGGSHQAFWPYIMYKGMNPYVITQYPAINSIMHNRLQINITDVISSQMDEDISTQHKLASEQIEKALKNNGKPIIPGLSLSEVLVFLQEPTAVREEQKIAVISPKPGEKTGEMDTWYNIKIPGPQISGEVAEGKLFYIGQIPWQLLNTNKIPGKTLEEKKRNAINYINDLFNRYKNAKDDYEKLAALDELKKYGLRIGSGTYTWKWEGTRLKMNGLDLEVLINTRINKDELQELLKDKYFTFLWDIGARIAPNIVKIPGQYMLVPVSGVDEKGNLIIGGEPTETKPAALYEAGVATKLDFSVGAFKTGALEPILGPYGVLSLSVGGELRYEWFEKPPEGAKTESSSNFQLTFAGMSAKFLKEEGFSISDITFGLAYPLEKGGLIRSEEGSKLFGSMTLRYGLESGRTRIDTYLTPFWLNGLNISLDTNLIFKINDNIWIGPSLYGEYLYNKGETFGGKLNIGFGDVIIYFGPKFTPIDDNFVTVWWGAGLKMFLDKKR